MAKPPNPALARRILDIACEELEENPPDRVNMRSLALRAGVSPTAIYYYFASKDALFEAIKFEALDALLVRIEAATSAAAPALAKLEILVRVFLDWCGESPHVARLLMEELPAREDLEETELRRYYSIADLAKGYLEAAVAEGSLGPRDLELDISVAQAALWGLFAQFRGKRVYPRFWESIDPLVDRFMELFIGKQGESS
jgi:AcrR family transcriptional regulator